MTSNGTNTPNNNNTNNAEIQKQINYSRYKTELCRQFIENGECKYGDKCQFAHGLVDLKDVNRHPKYKTDYCKTFHSKGFCPYGPRCHFIHELSEKFDPSIPNVSTASKKPKPEELKVVENPSDAQLIEKQLEAIQAQLTSNLFSSMIDEAAENDAKESADKKLDEQSSQFLYTSSSGTTSPLRSSYSLSSNSAPSSVSSAPVSSSTSPTSFKNLNKLSSRVIGKHSQLSAKFTSNSNGYINSMSMNERANTPNSVFEVNNCNINKSEMPEMLLTASMSPQSSSPTSPLPRTRSNTSSTSSASSTSSSTSSFDFNTPHELGNAYCLLSTYDSIESSNDNVFSPVKQQQQAPQKREQVYGLYSRAESLSTAASKSLGPIGRPFEKTLNKSESASTQSHMYNIERINSLLLQCNLQNMSQVGSQQNMTSSSNELNAATAVNGNNFYQLNTQDRQLNW